MANRSRPSETRLGERRQTERRNARRRLRKGKPSPEKRAGPGGRRDGARRNSVRRHGDTYLGKLEELTPTRKRTENLPPLEEEPVTEDPETAADSETSPLEDEIDPSGLAQESENN